MSDLNPLRPAVHGKVRRPSARSRWHRVLATALLVWLTACGDEAGTAQGTAGGGQFTLDKQAKLQVTNTSGGGQIVGNGGLVLLPIGGLQSGSQLTVELMVANLGTADLKLSNVQFQYTPLGTEKDGPPALQCSAEGAGGAGVPCSGNLPTLAVGSKPRKLTFTFTKPSDDATRSAVLTMDTSDPAVPAYKITLKTNVGQPRLQLQPAVLDFGFVAVGATKQMEAVVNSAGSVALVVNKLDLGALPLGQFEAQLLDAKGAVLKLPSQLAPGTSAKLVVSHKSKDEAPILADLVVQTNDNSLTQDGGAGWKKLAIKVNVTGPCLKLSPAAVEFGAVSVGAPAKQDVQLQSCGDESVCVEAATFDAPPGQGPFGIEWTLSGGAAPTPNQPLCLDKGKSATVTVSYVPTAIAAKTLDGAPVVDKASISFKSTATVTVPKLTLAGYGACLNPDNKAETCNGVDDDCDGQTDEATCDDGNPCTTDLCNGKEGCAHKPLDGGPCDADGSVCTVGDSCQSGACLPGGALVCDDKNPCTQDSCDLAKGCSQVVFDGVPCDADGTACTAGDTCQGGICKAGVQVVCDDGNPCTKDTCDLKSGQCVASAEDDGIPCDDGSKCTQTDACKSSVCKGSAVNCDDGNPCTDHNCAPATGCSMVALSGPACSDDNPCTVGDACNNGACQAGVAKVCVPPNGCVVASCDAASGACNFVAVNAGTPCDDGNACTGKDACNGQTCLGQAQSCDDGNVCTDDSCDAASGCATAANNKPCSDGSACTLGDMCADKTCQAVVTTVCSDGKYCTADSCDPQTGNCVFDGLPLQGKACDADGSLCTDNDTCLGGACQAGASLACDDKNVCTSDSCDAKLGCVHVANALPCNADDTACTVGDVCADKACQAGAKTSCDDNNPCTADGCDPATGACVFDAVGANGKSCNDGDACTEGDGCLAGLCSPGTPKVCNDLNVCTTDTCNPLQGCQFKSVAAPCDDGEACTTGDVCDGDKCKPGSATVCNDNKACTVDKCDPVSGACLYLAIPDGALCNDGNACTTQDKCSNGVCAGAKLSCSDGNVCTDDICNIQYGCVFLDNTAFCEDGDSCVGNDMCKDGVCLGGYDACYDGDPTSIDSCDAATGLCSHKYSEACDGLDNDGNGKVDDVTCGGGLACTCSNGVTYCPATCKACPAYGDYPILIDDNGAKKLVCAHDYPAWGVAPNFLDTLVDNKNGTITDTRTGLQWQNPAQLAPNGYTWAAAMAYCDTLNLGGYADWRGPTQTELASLFNFAAGGFVPSADYTMWTASKFNAVSQNVVMPKNTTWTMRAQSGVQNLYPWSNNQVRCVRSTSGGAPQTAWQGRLVVNLNANTLYDKVTKLTWERSPGQGPTDGVKAASYCADLVLDGKSDWRLPHIRELMSLVDPWRYSPAFGPNTFAGFIKWGLNNGAGVGTWWSKTPWFASSTEVWTIVFFEGTISHKETSTGWADVHCVRP